MKIPLPQPHPSNGATNIDISAIHIDATWLNNELQSIEDTSRFKLQAEDFLDEEGNLVPEAQAFFAKVISVKYTQELTRQAEEAQANE